MTLGGADKRRQCSVTSADLFEEPGHQGAQDEGVVGLAVVEWQADVAALPQVALPAVQVPGCGTNVKQDDVRVPLNQPAAKMDLPHHKQGVRTFTDSRSFRKSLRSHQLCCSRHLDVL